MDKQTNILNDIKNALDKLVNGVKAEEVEVNAMEITLADGMTVWVESEDGDFVGKAIYSEQGGNPLEDGSYALEDGRTLIVAEGVITEVVEAEEGEDIEALKSENEELKNELETLRAANEETSKALEAEKEVNAQNGEAINSILAKIDELESENKAMAKVTVGGEAPLKKAAKASEVKTEKEGSEGFLAFMKGKGKF